MFRRYEAASFNLGKFYKGKMTKLDLGENRKMIQVKRKYQDNCELIVWKLRGLDPFHFSDFVWNVAPVMP